MDLGYFNHPGVSRREDIHPNMYYKMVKGIFRGRQAVPDWKHQAASRQPGSTVHAYRERTNEATRGRVIFEESCAVKKLTGQGGKPCGTIDPA